MPHPVCRSFHLKIYQQILKIIFNRILFLGYCQAIKGGDEKEWMFLWKRLKFANNANEKRSIMYGLACTSQVWILQRYLDMTIDPNSEIRKQDGASVISYIARYGFNLKMSRNTIDVI